MRDDSSVDSGGDHSDAQPDEGNQLVQYQPAAASESPFMDALLQPLQSLGGFEADSMPTRANPEQLTEVPDHLPTNSHFHCRSALPHSRKGIPSGTSGRSSAGRDFRHFASHCWLSVALSTSTRPRCGLQDLPVCLDRSHSGWKLRRPSFVKGALCRWGRRSMA